MAEPLYIFGAGQTAAAVYALIRDEGLFDVVGFCVDADRPAEPMFEGRPILRLSEADRGLQIFVAIGFKDLNHDRRSVYERLKADGWRFASVVSKKAIIRNGCQIGSNCLVMELNNLQAGVILGDNCFLWSGNHIGHHTTIGSHCYVSSHCVISGSVTVGDHTFLGVNSAIGDNLKIGAGCIVGQGASVESDLSDYTILRAAPGRTDTRSAAFNRRLLRR